MTATLKILVACEFSGVVREAFIARGHEAMSCDYLETEIPGPHYVGSVFDVIDYPWDLGIFHFPCTNTSVSGARHFAEKKQDGRQQASVALFMKGWRFSAHIPKVAFEHPVSIMSNLFRKPDQIIQPWQFGHPEVKATCLWLRGLPKLEPTNIVEGREPRVHFASPGPDRWKERSRTLRGIAEAMATQWINTCACPTECDCENLEGETKHISNSCPEHNIFPIPDYECPTHGARLSG